MDESRERRSLSKNLLKMKFMQRTEEAKLRQQLEDEEKREIDEAHWVLDNVEGAKDEYVWSYTFEEAAFKNRNVIEYEPSYVVCEDLVPTGRMSFKRFNPAIEKLFQELTSQKELAECEAREREDTVTAEQMAERYDSLIDTVDKKFAKKRKRRHHADVESLDFHNARPSKKQKARFRKPKED
ncbi:M-phase phosphoprotein 6-like isoform X1 [Dendronephthya gigantea]|uniref:M-phase phosphoprotein 6-like isoform X1 n=1 Tax=Dendronephthya gigantea TaxID=151771 RepID=UPI00106B1D58|nr:M-phase phosphoprotein 6-like isoform X1 [Dendronephthya gigantea]